METCSIPGEFTFFGEPEHRYAETLEKTKALI